MGYAMLPLGPSVWMCAMWTAVNWHTIQRVLLPWADQNKVVTEDECVNDLLSHLFHYYFDTDLDFFCIRYIV